ncbi:MAG: LicD family protein [Eubacterium sp.]|nr:LicD family protein [Eubacterium sp.]
MKKEVSEVLMNLLIRLDEVCRRHHLRYYLAYGTCIGAVRHKGFIPWDHDIDVLMPIRDAVELTKYQDEFGPDLFVQSRKTDPNYISIAYKLRDSSTAYVWDEYKHMDFNQGISLDIYPFYNAPKTKPGLLLNIWRSHIYKVLVAGYVPENHGKAAKLMSKFFLTLFRGKSRGKMIRRMEYKLRKVPKGKEILDYYGLDITLCSAITYPREWFGKPKLLEFEGRKFFGPTEPEKYLTKRYGDFMTLPPVEKQVDPNQDADVVIDTEKSYREYLEL